MWISLFFHLIDIFLQPSKCVCSLADHDIEATPIVYKNLSPAWESSVTVWAFSLDLMVMAIEWHGPGMDPVDPICGSLHAVEIYIWNGLIVWLGIYECIMLSLKWNFGVDG